MRNMNIILFGYRGSGKSTVGKQVAKLLGCDFVDTDDEIVKRFDGLTIAKIWEQYGEPAFRQMETLVTQGCLQRRRAGDCVGGRDADAGKSERSGDKLQKS